MERNILKDHETGAQELLTLLRSRNDKQLRELSAIFDGMSPDKIRENVQHLRKYVELLEHQAMVNV